MARVLITGMSGTIGSELASSLEREGHQVEGVPHNGLRIQEKGYFSEVKNPNTIDVVYHLAAKSFVPDSWGNPGDFIEVNTLGTTRTLEFCRAHDCKIILISSYAYGIPKYLPIDEKHPLSAVNPYALSKKMSEELCQFYGAYYDLSYAIVRPFNVYGALGNKALLIPEIIEQILKGDSIKVKDLKPKRDYIFIDDLVSLLIRVMDYDKNEVFNAGSGEALSVKEVIGVCQRVFGSNLPVESAAEVRKNEIPITRCDTRFVTDELGWQPLFTFEDGIRKMKEKMENG